MREGFVVDRFPLCPKMGHDLRDLDAIPVQDGIGHEAQTTGFVHKLLVIAGRKFPLVGKENPAGQLVAVFALIELELDRPSQLPIGQIAQNVLGFDDGPPGAFGLKFTVSSNSCVRKGLEGQKNTRKRLSMMAYALTPWGLTRWIPTEHLVFSRDTAHDPL